MSDHQVNLTRLRERAERAIAREEASLASDGGASTGLESRQLVEEMHVYQTELEIQNEELNQAQSQLAQTLERYRLLFEHLPLPALVVDDRGLILEVNRQASDLLNLDRPSGQHRGALFQLFDFDSRAPLHLYFRGLAPPGPQILTSLLARMEGDQTLPCDLHLMPLAARPFQGRQTLAVLVDRTNELALRDSERRWRALSQDYQLAKREAESANQAKSAFLATMSHEFRTPMNAILGLTDLLLSSEPTPGRSNYLRKIHDVAGALYGLLNDILDYSKIEAGHLQVEAIPLRLAQVLARTRALFELRAAEKRLILAFRVAPEVPPLLRGDPLRLGQVINNLVGNALKFTERGAIQVKVERAAPSGETAAGEVLLKISVRDTGIGLTAEQRERLFRPFQQADMSTTRQYGGTGLGLSISKRLVALMGGEIGVDSRPGEGSTFWFTVRLGALAEGDGPGLEPGLPATAAPGAPAAAPRYDQLTAAIRGKRVLVAEDSPSNRLIVKAYLEKMGLEVETAENGHRAVEMAAQGHFDAILMDLQMPGLDGLGATRAIRAAGGRLPIIALTAAAMDEDRGAGAAAGMNAHVTKPIDPLQLASTLVQWLGGAGTSDADADQDGPLP